MKNLVIIISLLTLTSCIDFDQTVEYSVDPALEVYIESFFNEAQLRGIDIPHENLIVEFGVTDHTGLSHKRGNQRIITIDPAYKTKIYQHVELVVYHEMGHALLGLRHIEDHDAIMNAHPRQSLLATDSINRARYISSLLIFENR